MRCLLLAGTLLWPTVGCSDQQPAQTPSADSTATAAAPDPVSEAAQREAAARAAMDRDFPLHGLITGLQLRVRAEPDPEANIVGWLRVGSRIRLSRDRDTSATCRSGWYPIHPRGHVCVGEGVEVGDAPPTSEIEVPPPERDAALPYAYYYVKEPAVPEYHRLPSRDEQRAALAYSARYLEILAQNDDRAARFLAGQLPNELTKPPVVQRYLDRGFFIAATGTEIRASRTFVRTVQGRYVKEAQLISRTGSDFHGVDVDADHPLPLAWAIRSSPPLIKRERADGTIRWIDDVEAAAIERLTFLESWRGRENIGGQVMHVLEGDRYLKAWFAAVAERIPRPEGVDAGQPWVHVDLSEQTLVVYRGDEPVFATLVSTGLEGHDTPVGIFDIRRKLIADTMANIGPDAGDERYRIEDVPWVQYFEGSVALHGAFWHERFGLTRSHGCVNIAPRDAHRVFLETIPEVPLGWLGVSTDRTAFAAGKVVVTP